MNLFLDIETVPREDPTEKEIKACSACKKEDTIEADFKANYDTLLQKALKKKGTGYFDSKIVCLSFAFDDDDVQAITGSEEYIMSIFESNIKEKSPSYSAIFLIGFNIKGFDAPVIYLRSCLYDKKETKHAFFFGKKKMVDVQDLACYWQYQKYPSLDNTCKFFGIEGKEGIDGSMVYPLYKEGKIEEIANYCNKDVEKTRALYKLLHV